jgi:hypothetical protein
MGSLMKEAYQKTEEEKKEFSQKGMAYYLFQRWELLLQSSFPFYAPLLNQLQV